jgi:hypothetical protein
MPTVTLLMPTARVIRYDASPVGRKQHNPPRQTSFCGVFRPETQPSSAAR